MQNRGSLCSQLFINNNVADKINIFTTLVIKKVNGAIGE